jgi:acyl-CoA oxidase
MYEIITPSQALLLSDVYRSEIINMTAREAVQITDAFGFTDYELGSVLGRYDGLVYETLWNEVKKDPVNSDVGLRDEVLKMLKGNWGNASNL